MGGAVAVGGRGGAATWAAGAALVAITGCGVPHPPAHRTAADGRVMDTSDTTWVRDVIAPGRPTVVYFWAQGCIPCYAVGPRVRHLAARYAGRVTFWKMDMGWSAARVQRFGISGWPALGFYVGDRVILRRIGVPTDHMDDSLDAFVDEGLRRKLADSAQATGARPHAARPE